MKKILIVNHYATPPSLGGLTRHHYFAKYLKKAGYDVKILSSSAIHNSSVNMFNKNDKLYTLNNVEGVDYIHVKTCQYKNKVKRVLNMLEYFVRAMRTSKKIEKPDVIYASSPQPLSALLGIKIAKKYNVPCIVEIRDLWPESIVSFNLLKRNNIIIKLLFKLEKYIYLHADKLVFTMEGALEYLKEQKYSDKLDFNKIYNINNGIDLKKYKQDYKLYQFEDKDLDNDKVFKVVYTGSIRYIYNIQKIVEVAEKLKKKKILFIIYGEGPYKEELIQYCKDNNIKNVVFKGFVDVKYIPYILSKIDLCLLHGNDSDVFKYGMSTNKSFMYLASGKPILSTYNNKYDLISKYNCGIILDDTSVENYANKILEFITIDKKQYDLYCKNSLKLSKEYDYKKLTDKLIDIIEER